MQVPDGRPRAASVTGLSRSSAPENLLDIIAGDSSNDGYDQQMSLCCLAPSNPLRMWCIRVIRNPWFDRLAMLAILTNCVQMAVQDPLMDTTSEKYRTSVQSNLHFDSVIVGLFTVEMGFKVVAMGFVAHKNAYMRDRWNWIDFMCVVSGWVDLASTWAGDANSASVLTSLRAVRVLRPLRTLTQLPGMKELIACMLGSIPQLGNVVGILFFFLMVFGILGVQLFHGQLRHQCWGPGEEDGSWGPTGDVCNPFGDALTYSCEPPFECRCGVSGLRPLVEMGGSSSADAGSKVSHCLESDNPNFGITHFDHFWGAFITIFQSITLEGWVDNMYWTQDGASLYAWLYFVLVVTFGAFLVVQLFLAVLSDAFNSESSRDAGAPAAEEEYEDKDGDGIMDLDMSGRPWLQVQCYRLVSLPVFRHTIHFFIVLNTVLMCCEYYGQPPEEEAALSNINLALTLVFTLELVAKVIAMGPINCLRDTFNRFDAIVVVLSLLEVVLDFAGTSFVNLAVLRAFRLIRLIRVFKLVRSLKGLNHLMRALFGSLRSVSSLAILLLLLVLVYALLGVELFGGIYTPPPRGRNASFDLDEVPAANFDSFFMACISIFIVLSGENWNEVYFNTAHGLETLYGQSAYREMATFYFLSLFVLGNYVVFNLFVAIILLHIDMDDDADSLTDEQKAAHVDGTGKIVFAFGSLLHVEDESAAQRIYQGAGSRAVLAELQARPLAGVSQQLSDSQWIRQSLTMPSIRKTGHSCSNLGGRDTGGDLRSLVGAESPSKRGWRTSAGADSPNKRGRHTARDLATAAGPRTSNESVESGADAAGDARGGRPTVGGGIRSTTSTLDSSPPLPPPPLWPEGTPDDRSLLIFSHSSAVRRACARLMAGPHFDRVILVLIFASSLSLAYDTPTQTELTARALSALNWVFTIAFAIEMAIKVIALGFIWPAPTAYLRSAWNMLDFVIVSISVVLLALEASSAAVSGQLSWLKALRVVRALRPLRMANRISGMKKVVNSLFMAAPQCANVSLLMIMFVFIFSIIGVQLFKGKFYECTDGVSRTRDECLTSGERWVNPSFGNFDNVGYGILVLLEMVGLEGWPSVMFRGMYATEIGMAPMRDDRSGRVAYALFFIVWIFAGAFLVWNLFVGVVLDTFNQLRKKDDGTAFMTNDQRDWMEAQRTVYAMRPLRQFECPSRSPFRRRVFALVQSTWFDLVVIIFIVLNAMVMMLEWHDKPDAYALALQTFNTFFGFVFLVEMVLKLIALGVRQYVSNGWNAFDGVLVTLSVIDLTFELAGDLAISAFNPNILRVLRMFRVVRLLRVVKTAKGLRTMLVTLWSSLPALQNVGLLLGLVMYIYAIAGMLMFADVPYGECLNRHANFRGFWISLLTLFRCSTGESWNCIMHDAMGGDWGDNAARCVDGEGAACGNTGIAAFFFLSYWILGQAILLNLVIGVILENFSAIGSENRPITVEQLEVSGLACAVSRGGSLSWSALSSVGGLGRACTHRASNRAFSRTSRVGRWPLVTRSECAR
jgi:hypothetical protein